MTHYEAHYDKFDHYYKFHLLLHREVALLRGGEARVQRLLVELQVGHLPYKEGGMIPCHMRKVG